MEAVSLVYTVVSKFEIAFITLFAGLLISRIVGKVAKRMLAEAELNRLFAAKGARSISDIVGSTIEGLLYFVTVLIVLQQLGLANIVLYLLILLLLLFMIALIFIGIKQSQNIFAWFVLKPFLNKNLGKKVQIGDIAGKLKSFNLLQSHLAGAETFFVPHAYSLKQKVRKIREG